VIHVKSFPRHVAHRAALIPNSMALSQATAARSWTLDTGQCVVRCACLLPPSYAGTTVHCLVKEANVCEQLALGGTRQCSGWDWTGDLQQQVKRPKRYVTHRTINMI